MLAFQNDITVPDVCINSSSDSATLYKNLVNFLVQ